MADLLPIERIFFGQPHRICQKWLHYFSAYERHFARFRGQPLKFLEIGVSQGGSLDLWASYFGPEAQITGLDIDPQCLRFEAPRRHVIIGDQGDRDFLRRVADEVGEVDIILDDGGHTMLQQIASFEILFPIVRNGGVYMCEDVHTSYHDEFGGGLKRPGTFIEYMKDKIDEMHFWSVSGSGPTDFTKSASSISIYNSIVAIEKQVISHPLYVEIGRSF